jgi:hypothetical protein
MTEGINPLGFLESKIDTEITLLKQIATSLGNAPLTTVNGFSMPFQFVQIDLTVVNTQKVINCPVNPVNWIQAISDGALDGITLWLDNPGTTAISLKDLPTIQTNGTTLKQVYLTSDVRSGRSYLRLYFSQTTDPLQFNFGGQDISLSEAAVRQGSFDTFDRRGNILWKDDFSGGLNMWNIGAAVGGPLPCISSDFPLNPANGGISAKIIVPAGNNKNSGIVRRDVYPSASRFGAELAFMTPNGILNCQFDLCLDFYIGGVLYAGILRYDGTIPAIQYWNSSLAYTTIIPALPLAASYNNYHRLKIVVDAKLGQYVRLILDNNLINLSGVPLAQAANVTPPQVFLEFNVTNQDAANPHTVYVANAIMTINEP